MTKVPEQFVDIFAGQDLHAIESEVAIIDGAPRPSHKYGEAPIVIAGPFTRAAREIALQKDLRIHTQRFIDLAEKSRGWQPWNLPSRSEVVELGDKLSDDTVKVINAFLYTELRIKDYVQLGLKVINDGMSRLAIGFRWAGDEIKHPQTLADILVLSGKMSEAERVKTEREADADLWDPKDHNGLDDEYGYGYIAYGIAQERLTAFFYRQLRKMVRADNSLGDKRTEAEIKRGYELGASEHVRIIGGDETAHQMAYIEQARIIARYFPERMYESLVAVQEGFKLPKADKLPNRRRVLFKLMPDEDSQGIYLRTFDYISNSLGLENKEALAQAAQNSLVLKDMLEPGAFQLNPDGTFKPLGSLAEIALTL